MAYSSEYSFNELTDMILLYGEAERNSAAAAPLYAERYPQRRHPNRRTFTSHERRLRETGRIRPIMTHADRPRSRRSADVENVLHVIERFPGTSTRRLARRHLIYQRMVVRVLHDQLLYPFHVHHRCIMSVEERSANGYCSRMQRIQPFSAKCCCWMKHASHRMGFLILVTSTHGLMKIHIPLKKHDFNSSFQ
jgi:hypothetical protein